jgi:hypothetical protein
MFVGGGNKSKIKFIIVGSCICGIFFAVAIWLFIDGLFFVCVFIEMFLSYY